MSEVTIDPRTALSRTAPKRALRLSWSDPRFRSIVWQVAILGTVAGIAWYLIHNTSENLASRRIATGFGFLDRTAGIPIGESLISYNPAESTYGRALIIGILNTLKVAVVGVVLATILGTFIGIGRLSKNWLMAKLTAFYVETIRDLPLLLQLLFWYTILQGLPAPRQSMKIGEAVFLSNRGLKYPVLEWETAHTAALIAFLAGVIGTFFWNRRARLIQEATGIRPDVWRVALGSLVVVPLIVWVVLGAPFQWDLPVLRGFNFQGGGSVSPEYFALLLGLVTYTAGYIAEIVRSGIEAIPLGQWEAAGALGLKRGAILRRIVLPQALRVIIPPMTSQYLNLTKNSSLAVAIGYQDLVSIANTTLNQTGQAIEGIAVIMAVYLTISLSISLFMNWYNAHIALVGTMSTTLVTVARPSPPGLGAAAWVQANLFGSWVSTAVTLALGYVIVRVIIALVEWAVIGAVWTVPYTANGIAETAVCQTAKGTGACWAVIADKYRLILFGRYPYNEQWRPAIVVLIFIGLYIVSAMRRFWRKELVLIWVGALTVVGVLMWGGIFGLSEVQNDSWGGLPITLILATFGLAFGFPLAVLVALGRRSTQLPAVRMLCVVYVELIRGVPLISVLFMASVMFPLFMPAGVNIDKLLRAQIAITLFAAAYLAEVVRGGLQALPKGQTEAADALGLSYWHKTGFIILPQALRLVIPPLVNTFIGFFKDTSLVLIIGLFDLLTMGKVALSDPPWQSFSTEVYVFLGVIYIAFCYAMSRYSRGLERELGRSHRR